MKQSQASQHYQGKTYFKYVDVEHAGRRLDNYLLSLIKKVPKSHIYKIIQSGEVRVDGRRAKASDRVEQGQKIRIPPMTLFRPKGDELKITAQEKEFILQHILHEEEQFLVLNKPSNYAVHAGGQCNFGLTEILRALFSDVITPVHRLDRGTSGCLLFAKTHPALRELHQLFRNKQIHKEYLALVIGLWDPTKTVLDDPLTVRHHRQGANIVVDYEHGNKAVTRFEIVQLFTAHTLLKAYPLSGRMHQIRVHAMHHGHPIAGDRRYGNFEENRALMRQGLQHLFLHAEMLEFEFCGRSFSFQAELPDDRKVVLNALSGNS